MEPSLGGDGMPSVQIRDATPRVTSSLTFGAKGTLMGKYKETDLETVNSRAEKVPP